jgi:hypothetical protein
MRSSWTNRWSCRFVRALRLRKPVSNMRSHHATDFSRNCVFPSFNFCWWSETRPHVHPCSGSSFARWLWSARSLERGAQLPCKMQERSVAESVFGALQLRLFLWPRLRKWCLAASQHGLQAFGCSSRFLSR